MVGSTCSPRCLGKLVLLSATIAYLQFTLSTSAQTYLQNEYNLVNKQKLNCTANDVRIAKVDNIRDPITGKTISTCFDGSTFNFIADFEIVTTSAQARENVGLYIATNSTTQALTGTCVDNIISPVSSDNYHETDAAPDNCGDTSSGDFSATYGAGAEKVTLEIDNFSCTAPKGSSTLVLPNCTSWQIPGGTIQCVSTAPAYAYPFNGPNGTPTAIPGSPSKCNCDVISIPVTPVTASAVVQKACTTTLTTGPVTFTQNPNTETPTKCDAGPEGSTVTYTVGITNTSTSGGLVVDQICDDAYGTIYDDGKFKACAAGTSGITATNVSCPPATIALGATGTCTFTAPVGENLTGLVDIVTASGHSAVNTSSTFTQGSNSVTVTSSDAPSTASVTKGVVDTTAACATVRYSVDVANTSGADEDLSLTGLSDSAFGDLTKCTNAGCTNTGGTLILGTTCGIDTASNGLGTLSGAKGAGAFSASLPVGGSDYKCQFDAQFCSGLDANSCISNVDTITPSLTADESADKVTVTANKLTVKECLSTTVTSQ